ncbi:hypothetical protein [Dyadobacter aurulentus]|uniref:hypothetical protein n=1 Tax=Dyadobacter sp. UC 10 TaxID=2605428 RepID=UPI0011F16812|nr:hypothetical protein [Dyadobacter sp. UC 10]KAA0990968.1 hypothetical protein FXO21_12790 [Dyadobacter sp. UC 10]
MMNILFCRSKFLIIYYSNEFIVMRKTISLLSVSLASMCFVSAVVMTGCSKENQIEPIEGRGQSKTGENLTDNPNLRIDPPIFDPIIGQPGIGSKPDKWLAVAPGNSIYAVSTLKHLGGDASKAWVKALPEPASGANAILTTSTGMGQNSSVISSHCTSIIKNLVAGKKYMITFKVSTTSTNLWFGNSSPYATAAKIILGFAKNDGTGFGDPNGYYDIEKTVDLTGKQAEWVTVTMTFTATKYDTRFTFQNATPTTQRTFTNLHVGLGAIKQIDDLLIPQ